MGMMDFAKGALTGGLSGLRNKDKAIKLSTILSGGLAGKGSGSDRWRRVGSNMGSGGLTSVLSQSSDSGVANAGESLEKLSDPKTGWYEPIKGYMNPETPGTPQSVLDADRQMAQDEAARRRRGASGRSMLRANPLGGSGAGETSKLGV
jgi:hypothetical protein